MKIGRMLKHLFAPPAERLFGADSLERIAQAIASNERRHSGEVCFAVESALPWQAALRGVDARSQALAAFSRLSVWDTAANNGVLLYLLLADRDDLHVADRAIHRKVGEQGWEAICQRMEAAFRDGRYVEGVVAGIREISALLAEHFPGDASDPDEIPNKPTVL